MDRYAAVRKRALAQGLLLWPMERASWKLVERETGEVVGSFYDLLEVEGFLSFLEKGQKS